MFGNERHPVHGSFVLPVFGGLRLVINTICPVDLHFLLLLRLPKYFEGPLQLLRIDLFLALETHLPVPIVVA